MSKKIPPPREQNPHAIVNRARFEIPAVDRAMTQLETVNTSLFAQVADLITQLMSDDRTKLLNRRGFIETVNNVQSQNDQVAQAGKSPKLATAIMLIDLDHFKTINDTFGHDAGDKVLVAAAKAMKAMKFPEVKFAAGRWGGDEMVIAVTGSEDTVSDNIQAIAGTVRESIKEACRITSEGTLSKDGDAIVSASIGVSILGDDIDLAIEQADKAVYVSKDNGRDCVTLYTSALDTIEKRPVARSGAISFARNEALA